MDNVTKKLLIQQKENERLRRKISSLEKEKRKLEEEARQKKKAMDTLTKYALGDYPHYLG